MSRNARVSGTAGNLIGSLLIAAGVIIAGNVLDWWDISIFFKGWWTLFIILPCAGNVRRYGMRTGWGAGLVVGVILLLSQWLSFSIGWMIKLAVPVLLILYGLYVISSGVHFDRAASGSVHMGSGRSFRCNAFFSGNETNYPGEEFFGASTSAIFGGSELNLRNAIIVEDVTIDATAIFGGVEIYLPDDVNVRLTSTALFAGVENHIKRAEVAQWPTVYIRATSIFGGVEIY